jgi:hypothetical protein
MTTTEKWCNVVVLACAFMTAIAPLIVVALKY